MNHRQAHITLVNGMETSAIELNDRGLNYGDGVFETMRALNGHIPLLEYHLARFAEGVERLQLGNVKKLSQQLKTSLKQVLHSVQGDGLIKVIVTRGLGGRGYTPLAKPQPNQILQVFDYPDWPASYAKKGIDVICCQHRLSTQPALAGIKHLNRLDQVLASTELGKAHEGLMRDLQGRFIEGTKSNLLVFEKDRVITPTIHDAGVEGTLLAFLLDTQSTHGVPISKGEVTETTLADASGLAMVNSVFGCWPVKKLDNKTVPLDKRVKPLMAHLNNQLGFTFSL